MQSRIYSGYAEAAKRCANAKDFRGAVQSDGYGAYDIYENKQGVLLLGCWAHVRRKFEHALSDDPERAQYALRVIGELYAIERRVKEQGLPPDGIKAIREKEAYPLIREFERWIEKQANATSTLRYRFRPVVAPELSADEQFDDETDAATGTMLHIGYLIWISRMVKFI